MRSKALAPLHRLSTHCLLVYPDRPTHKLTTTGCIEVACRSVFARDNQVRTTVSMRHAACLQRTTSVSAGESWFPSAGPRKRWSNYLLIRCAKMPPFMCDTITYGYFNSKVTLQVHAALWMSLMKLRQWNE